MCLLASLLFLWCTCISGVVSQSSYSHQDPFGPYLPFQPLPFHPKNEFAPASAPTHSCRDHNGRPQGCKPEFVNAAFNRSVDATNTCGVAKPTTYCYQTSYTGDKICDRCDARDDHRKRPAEYLTDKNDNNTQTYWQSETMFDGVEQVNLTLYLGKTFDITYVRLKFHSPRPESMAIYKKTDEDSDWVPFQFYSRFCDLQYRTTNIRDNMVTRENETSALCTSAFSDITPVTGGNVIFTTLDHRPSQENLENNPALQEFIQASHIRIVLDKMNTFGDHLFKQEQVLQTYYYTISDLSVGGFCKCNGHASMCVQMDDRDSEKRLTCLCDHNTAGRSCEKCLDFYNDLPWAKGTATNAHECKACNCNGKSSRCFFDQDLWQRTGRGGHCMDCRDNTTGANCERCKDNFYQTPDARCVACNCNSEGSISLQCNSQGQCQCKPGVEGQRCDRCAANHYDFSDSGCKFCGCSEAGSWNNTATCNSLDGQCRCKPNAEGQRCDRCKPGYFDLQVENDFGCLPCFCFGHSSVCESALGFAKNNIDSLFSRDPERWTARTRSGQEVPFQYNAITKSVGVKASGREDIFFVAPDRYLGDQKASYNQFLSFSLRIGEDGPRATFEDVSFEGAGLTISQPIFGQGNPLPAKTSQQYRFRLHEDGSLYGWTPRLNAKDFISVLSNLTAIKVRTTYTQEGTGFVDDVRLESAQQLPYGAKASWIEMCKCPTGYVGQFCESCASGYRHNPSGGGSFAECVPCKCNGHAESCDPDSGQCFCDHNTGGDNCERCKDGFYGNALIGSATDCTACPCPEGGACVVLPDEQVACLNCPVGYAGYRCDLCIDGFHGDPTSGIGINRMCRECDCNENVDPNAVGNCNTTSGECLKCIFNTYGSRCERCLPGFYGDALALPKGQCRPCGCHHEGTIRSSGPVGKTYDTAFLCDMNGQCACKAHVMGRQCDRCVDGYYNLSSGEGCSSCDCNPIGSFNRTCDARSGQCHCRPGITGKKCDQCLPLHYGFSIKGCSPCECDTIGSTGMQCTEGGQCPCRPNVEGRRCERCRENKHNKAAGCVDCPVCYNLIQDAVTEHRTKLAGLSSLLDDIERNPQVVEDVKFEEQLETVTIKVDNLLREATKAQGTDGSLISQIQDLRSRIERIKLTSAEVKSRLEPITVIVAQGERNITLADELIDRAQESLSNARKLLDTEGRSALEKARERSKKFGQQSERMSDIARQARQLADKHEAESETIEKLAKEAVTTSNEAYRLALDAIQTQENNKLELQELQNKLASTTDLMDKTQKMAMEAKDASQKAYTEALKHYTDVNSMSIPTLESDRLRMEATDLINQAERILKEANDLVIKNGDILNSTNFQQQETRDLLNEAMRQQKITDDLLVEAFAAHAKANESIAAGEATLTDAKNTLETLNGFDRLVQESRGKAMEALDKIPGIRRQIDEAQSKTSEAENALQGALQDAIEARDVALEAQKIAEKASSDADKIREEADATKQRATKLRNEADVLSGNVEDTGNRMKDYEDQAASDEKLAKDALERVNQAKTSVFDADKKVSDALSTVKGIISALDGVQDIDANLLNELEKRLEQAEQELRTANLDSRLGTLKTAREQQQGWMRNYDAEIEKLKKDVANVNEIRQAIPETCYRRVRLEP